MLIEKDLDESVNEKIKDAINVPLYGKSSICWDGWFIAGVFLTMQEDLKRKIAESQRDYLKLRDSVLFIFG